MKKDKEEEYLLKDQLNLILQDMCLTVFIRMLLLIVLLIMTISVEFIEDEFILKQIDFVFLRHIYNLLTVSDSLGMEFFWIVFL